MRCGVYCVHSEAVILVCAFGFSSSIAARFTSIVLWHLVQRTQRLSLWRSPVIGSIGCGPSPAACVLASPTISFRAVFVQSEQRIKPVIYFMRRLVRPRVVRLGFTSVVVFVVFATVCSEICIFVPYLLSL